MSQQVVWGETNEHGTKPPCPILSGYFGTVGILDEIGVMHAGGTTKVPRKHMISFTLVNAHQVRVPSILRLNKPETNILWF